MNITGSLDTETGGLDPLTHSILSFSIVPMNDKFEIIKEIQPLKLLMNNPSLEVEAGALRINGLFEYQKHGTYKDAFLNFLSWMKKFNITTINPMGQELDFDLSFMQFWLGTAELRKMFTRDKRDTRRLAQALIDAGLYRGSTKLTALCAAFEVELTQAHTAFGDAMAVAELYPKMVALLRKGKKE